MPGGIEPDSGWLLKRIAEAPRQRIRFYLDAGTWEGKMALFSNRMLRSILAGKGYDVVYNESDGTHSAYFPDVEVTRRTAGYAGSFWRGIARGFGCRQSLRPRYFSQVSVLRILTT